ncbi:hypothetical protein BVRB_031230, partial [Beta vulgaris subsp. vulgaris]
RESELRAIMDKPELSLMDVCDRLRAYEANIVARFGISKQHKDRKSQDQLLFTGDETKPKRQPRGRCFNCGKRGHFAKDCRSPKKKEESSSTDELAFVAGDQEELYAVAESCYVDSGASRHMTGNKGLLSNFVELLDAVKIVTADGRTICGIGTGDMKVGRGKTVTLKDVLYVPDLKMNLLSVSAATANGA